MTPMLTLKAIERLKSKKQIDLLFSKGKQSFAYPFKIIYLIEERQQEEWPLKFSISVPKKKIKTAVKRNLIKRRTREAYRLNKNALQKSLSTQDFKISLMFIYLETDLKEFSIIEKSIKKHLNALISKISA
jgi:ribonuclease P protein component